MIRRIICGFLTLVCLALPVTLCPSSERPLLAFRVTLSNSRQAVLEPMLPLGFLMALDAGPAPVTGEVLLCRLDRQPDRVAVVCGKTTLRIVGLGVEGH